MTFYHMVMRYCLKEVIYHLQLINYRHRKIIYCHCKIEYRLRKSKINAKKLNIISEILYAPTRKW